MQFQQPPHFGDSSRPLTLLAILGLGLLSGGPAWAEGLQPSPNPQPRPVQAVNPAANESPLERPGLWPPIVQTAQPPLPGLGQYQAHVPVVSSALVLRLGERRVYLYRGTVMVRSYPVAIGRDGWETPTGHFQVIQKTVDPVWQHPFNGTIVPAGKDNPLGVRWIGFWTNGDNSIGFHGTPNPELIGQAVSHGCVRMRNEDIVDLFDRVTEGMPVRVEP